MTDYAAIANEYESASGSNGSRPAVEPVLVRLCEVTPTTVSWLWESRIPLGKVTVLDGDPGLGKSTVLLDLAARISRGRPMPDGTTGGVVGGAVILTAEDGAADTVVPRLLAVDADLERIVQLKAVRIADYERPPVIPEDLGAVREAVKAVNAVIVIVDPLMAFLSGEVNSWHDQDVRRALHLLAELAEDTGVAVVVLRHLNKTGGGRAVYRGGGSIGIIGAARSGLLIAKDPDNEATRVLAVVKSNLAAEAPSLCYHIEQSLNGASRIIWGGVSPHGANSLVAILDASDGDALTEAKRFLEDELELGPKLVRELEKEAERAGIATRTLRRARGALGLKPFKRGFGSGGEWVLSLDACKGGQEPPKMAKENDGRLRPPLAALGSEDPDGVMRAALREGA